MHTYSQLSDIIIIIIMGSSFLRAFKVHLVRLPTVQLKHKHMMATGHQ